MPVQNKACYERHLKKCHNSHLERLAKMKPTIDCHAPSSMRKVASKTNAKKQQIMVRLTELRTTTPLEVLGRVFFRSHFPGTQQQAMCCSM